MQRRNQDRDISGRNGERKKEMDAVRVKQNSNTNKGKLTPLS